MASNGVASTGNIDRPRNPACLTTGKVKLISSSRSFLGGGTSCTRTRSEQSNGSSSIAYTTRSRFFNRSRRGGERRAMEAKARQLKQDRWLKEVKRAIVKGATKHNNFENVGTGCFVGGLGGMYKCFGRGCNESWEYKEHDDGDCSSTSVDDTLFASSSISSGDTRASFDNRVLRTVTRKKNRHDDNSDDSPMQPILLNPAQLLSSKRTKAEFNDSDDSPMQLNLLKPVQLLRSIISKRTKAEF